MKLIAQIMKRGFIILYSILLFHLINIGSSAQILFSVSLILGALWHSFGQGRLSDNGLRRSRASFSSTLKISTRMVILVSWIGLLGLDAYFLLHQTDLFWKMLGCEGATIIFSTFLIEIKNLFPICGQKM